MPAKSASFLTVVPPILKENPCLSSILYLKYRIEYGLPKSIFILKFWLDRETGSNIGAWYNPLKLPSIACSGSNSLLFEFLIELVVMFATVIWCTSSEKKRKQKVTWKLSEISFCISLREKCPFPELFRSLLSPNEGKFVPKILRIRTLFRQCFAIHKWLRLIPSNNCFWKVSHNLK